MSERERLFWKLWLFAALQCAVAWGCLTWLEDRPVRLCFALAVQGAVTLAVLWARHKRTRSRPPHNPLRQVGPRKWAR